MKQDDKIPMDVASPEIKEFLSQIQQNPSKKPEIIKQNENIQEKKDEPKKIEAKKPIKNIIQEIEPSDSETSSTDDELGTVVLTKRDTVKEESIIQKQDDPNSVLDYPIMKIDKEIEFEQLDFVKFIARGSFKEVFKGLWLGLEVALMKLLCSGNLSESELREFKSELSLLSQLAHPNIVQFYGACTKEPNLCIVTEFCHGGTLLDYLQSDAEITRKHQYEIALDIVRGIYYLHANKIVHRDLKTPNILLDRHGDAKIADFGLSKTVNAARTHLNTLVGTFNWMAPEVMYGQNYSFPADIYALAIILWEISTRKIPFEGISAANLTKMIAIEKKRLPLPQDGIFNSLIEKCWDQDPNKRPTIKEVLMKLQRIKV
ncbi:serine/threonine-protein kinase tnni3k-related [Anaeramoeba ignava]|uniref:Serine/threonine-protein kinase tnni3k-related n=1 Tax=Anaeramoeba ignava TaxID=1746090 RepID=A0A9Q0LJA1_ANAIG|nr:serine/threonine-protein kinase tnni3k-related [Anaeramoeba ignava]